MADKEGGFKKELGGWRGPGFSRFKGDGGGGRYSCKIANWTRAGIYSRCGWPVFKKVVEF